MAQVKPLKLLSDGNYSQIDINNDDLTAGSFTSKQLVITSGAVGEKIIIQANSADTDTKIFNVKNSSGTSVASINENGNLVLNDLRVSGLANFEGSVFVTQNLTVSGNVTLGNTELNLITFNGVADSILDMNNNKIKNLDYPSDSNDAATKQFVLDNLSSTSWSLSGNALDINTYSEFLGTTTDTDLVFKRNNTEFMRLTKKIYDFGAVELLRDFYVANDIFDNQNTIIISSKEIEDNSDSYKISLKSGNTSTGNSGDVEVGSGGSSGGNSGNLFLFAADAPNGTRGQIYLDSSIINSQGNFLPDNDDIRKLGDSDLRWTSLYSKDAEITNLNVNGQNKLTINSTNLETTVNFKPNLDSTVSLGTSGFHFLNTFTENIGTGKNEDLNLIHNNQNAITISGSEITL